MIKLPCELIRDLLPLYHDGVCSDASKTVVEEHLKICDCCTATLTALDAQIEMPKLDADESKPLKAIRRRSIHRSILFGLAAFVVFFVSWFSLTQSCAVKMDADDFTVHTVVELSNGLCYVEYSHPYSFHSIGADIHRTDDGEIHLVYYRPRIVFKAKDGDQKVRNELFDPNGTIHSDNGMEIPHTAFYLGCPDEGNALLVWSADMDIPMATPEVEHYAMLGRIFK